MTNPVGNPGTAAVAAPPVAPMPTPVAWQLGRATSPDGTTLGVLQLQLVTGTVVVFMPRESVAEFGSALRRHAQTLPASGLVVADAIPGNPR